MAHLPPLNYFVSFSFQQALPSTNEPDGVIVASERFQITFPIAPHQYASFTSMVGSVEEAQAIYKEMLEAMVMQTMQRDLPDFLEGFLLLVLGPR